jgi:hypothetical protein
MNKLLREKYKTQEGARKRAAFENSLALSEFLRGHKPRHYRYRTVLDAEGRWRVARELPATSPAN